MQVEQGLWTSESNWEKPLTKNLSDSAQLMFVFGSTSNFKNSVAIINEAKASYPNAKFLGCSTSGEIHGTEVYDESFSFTAVQFDNTNVESAIVNVEDFSADSYVIGKELGTKLNKAGLKHVFIISDGLNVNGTDLAKGLTEVLPSGVSITGGLAGDGANFNETRIILDDFIGSKHVAALGFFSEKLEVGYGSLGGWNGFGPIREVTKSEGNVLFELDGKPALELYKKYLGDQAKGLPGTGLLFPLNIKTSDRKQGLVRTILAVDEATQSMTFAGDIPQGAHVQLMKANVDGLVDGAKGAADTVKENVQKETQLAILVSCVGRKLVMKQRTEEEVEEVLETLGEQTAVTGFYSYGELAPFKAGANCELHNQTCTITTFSE